MTPKEPDFGSRYSQEARKAQASIGQGSSVCMVKDLDLAVALATIGVPLREDPSHAMVEYVDGKKVVTFMFHTVTKDKKFQTKDLLEWYTLGPKWVMEHEHHPFAYVLSALSNRSHFLDHLKQEIPLHAFQNEEGSTLFARPGTSDYNEYVAMGLTRH